MNLAIRKGAQEGSVAVEENNKKRRKKSGGLNEMFNLQICPVCQKDYIMRDARHWAYQKQVGNKHLNFCSWGCYRKFLRDTGRL